jgi:integrase
VLKVSEDIALEKWLHNRKQGTQYVYRSTFKIFCDFVGMSGDQILASRKLDKTREWEKKVEDFDAEMRKTINPKTQKPYGSKYVKTMVATVKSFFEFFSEEDLDVLPLKFHNSTAKRMGESSRNTKDYLFDKETLFEMWKAGDAVDRYIIANKCMGLRSIDFVNLRRKDFDAVINKPVPIDCGEINTIKRNVVAHPFLDEDAKEAIQTMLKRMDAEGRTNPDDKILTFDKEQLTTRLQNLAKKVGVNSNGLIIRNHCIRKFFTDRVSAITSESKWKQFCGKKIGEGEYVSSLLLEKIFKKAIPMISFGHNGVNGSKLEALEKELAEQKSLVKAMVALFGEEILEKAKKQITVAKETGEPLTPIEALSILAKMKA